MESNANDRNIRMSFRVTLEEKTIIEKRAL